MNTNTTEKKTVDGTVRLLPEIREDLCCNRCQPVAQVLSDWLQLALMANTHAAREAVMDDFRKKARAFYGPM